MTHLKTAADIDAIQRAGRIIAELFAQLPELVAPGTTTDEIDAFADRFIRDHDGAVPAFKGLYGFPASVCASINHEVVHGIPSPYRKVNEGDIISIDVGVKLHGWFADAAITVPAGSVDRETERLLEVTRDALRAGIREARPGKTLGDVGHVIQARAENAGFSVVRELVGHGIGREPHEDPQVPNFGQPGQGAELQEGLVLAIEPMLNAGGSAVRTLPDRWTVVTADHTRSAHFEHTVAVTATGPKVLTSLNGE